MILALRTDKPEAELYVYSDTSEQVDRLVWTAHRQLSDTILDKITELLTRNKLSPQDIAGIISFQGPGSFTGLRIGITVANTLAYSLGVQHVGAMQDDWIKRGITLLTHSSQADYIVTPEYGADANITKPRK